MLRAVGFEDDDFKKPQIGIASTWSMVTPCNMHINTLADQAAMGANQAGGKAVIFNTITISDGISMGTEGMKYSLVSREVIADSIETVAGCEGFVGARPEPSLARPAIRTAPPFHRSRSSGGGARGQRGADNLWTVRGRRWGAPHYAGSGRRRG